MTDIIVTGAGGEYMDSVIVVEWHRTLGDSVAPGDLVVTVETAKAATEIEATVAGVLAEIRVAVGEEMAVGGVLGVISDRMGQTPVADDAAQSSETAVEPVVVPHAATAQPGGRLIASPLARRIAAQRTIDLADVTASSESGRIRLRDVEAYEKERRQQAGMAQSGARPAEIPPVSSATGDDGGMLHLVSRGATDASKIVFLHGFGADSYSWQPLLAAIGHVFHFILVDLPGHGGSPPLRGMSSIRQMADCVIETLAGNGIDDYHLVGHSLGGGVALAMMGTGRVSVRSLTLLAPAGLGPDIDGGFLSGYTRASQPESLAPWLAMLFADPSLASPGFVAATMQVRADHALREAQVRLADAIFPDGTQSADLRDVVRSMRIPQKIIWGEQDRIIPMRHALRTGGQAAVHFLPDVGHMPHIEEPDLVARLVMQNIRCAS